MNKVKGLIVGILLVGVVVPAYKVGSNVINIANYNKQIEIYKLEPDWIDNWFSEFKVTDTIDDATITDKKIALLNYKDKLIKCCKYTIGEKEYYGGDVFDIGDIAEISLHDNLIVDGNITGTDPSIDIDALEEELWSKFENNEDPDIDMDLYIDYGNMTFRNRLKYWHTVKVIEKSISNDEIPGDDEVVIYKYKLADVYADGTQIAVGGNERYIECYGSGLMNEGETYAVYVEKGTSQNITINLLKGIVQ